MEFLCLFNYPNSSPDIARFHYSHVSSYIFRLFLLYLFSSSVSHI